MFDTAVTLIGNVMTAPEWRRTAQTGTYVVTFRFASTSRRYDRTTNRWVDGDSLRIKVACWRKLGENVFESVQLGDPLVIHGRMYSRDWTDAEENRHTSYELDAVAVGHDLSRGVAKFARRRAVAGTDTVHDPATEESVGGEAAEAVESPGRPVDLPPDNELFTDFDHDRFDTSPVPPPPDGSYDPRASADSVDDVDDEDDEELDDEEVSVAA
ncbi:MAG TPA: single-stranded DNA-binding protein [Micromonosporaceae bacterium]|nr:single-stranded DNA-binding protein [Micromonosporaceae bacterium]